MEHDVRLGKGRGTFVGLLEGAAGRHGVDVAWFCDEWVAELGRGGRRGHVIGYAFPLNNFAAGQLARDKVAAARLLGRDGVPRVAHELVRFGTEAADATVARAELPVVVKPHDGDSGRDVLRAMDRAGLEAALGTLAARYRAVALSPYLDIEDEYRTVVLDGELLLAYRKVRTGTTQWRHNLGHGATPQVCADPTRLARLGEPARRAVAALGLRFATVDVVVAGGQELVLEVNGGVTLTRFAQHSPAYAELALDVYDRAIGAWVSDAG